MTEEFTLATREGSHNIQARVIKIGGDILVAFFGGDRPHIGAVSAAQPRPSLKDPETLSATASTICYSGHREDELTRTISARLSSELETNVVVCAGIHFDGIDEAGIRAVIKNCGIAADMIVRRLRGK